MRSETRSRNRARTFRRKTCSTRLSNASPKMRRKTLAHEVVFRPAAQRDLDALYRYIRDKGGGAVVAIGFIRRIREHCLGFANFPERGARRDDIRRGLRLVGFERKVTIAFSV